MRCCGKERGKWFWISRAIFIPIAIVAGVFILGTVVMYLWNSILPGVLGIGAITFWQAIGILVLSKILFGGCMGAGRRHKCCGHSHKWGHKWMNMTPEEREKLKADWHCKCDSSETEK